MGNGDYLSPLPKFTHFVRIPVSKEFDCLEELGMPKIRERIYMFDKDTGVCILTPHLEGLQEVQLEDLKSMIQLLRL